MTKPQGYCKGCKDRTAEDPEKGTRDCHRTCEKYRLFKKELADWHREYYKEKKAADLSLERPWLKKTKGDKDND